MLIWSAELVQEDPGRVEWQVSGRLAGRGICGVRAVDGGALLWWDWVVRPQLLWMRLVAPIARPVFSWNHRQLMDEGGAALAQRLGIALLSPPVSELRPTPRA